MLDLGSLAAVPCTSVHLSSICSAPNCPFRIMERIREWKPITNLCIHDLTLHIADSSETKIFNYYEVMLSFIARHFTQLQTVNLFLYWKASREKLDSCETMWSGPFLLGNCMVATGFGPRVGWVSVTKNDNQLLKITTWVSLPDETDHLITPEAVARRAQKWREWYVSSGFVSVLGGWYTIEASKLLLAKTTRILLPGEVSHTEDGRDGTKL